MSVATAAGPAFGVWLPHHGFFGAASYPGDPPDASYRNSRDIALAAERLGFASLLIAQQTISTRRADADVLEPWTSAAGIAEASSKIEIIAAIKPFLYNPGLLAKMALNIDQISEGRLGLNLVSGWFVPEMEKLGIPVRDHDERYAYAADWIDVVRRLFAGETVSERGLYGELRELSLRPGPATTDGPAIYLGGESEPAKDLAAAVADTFFINGRPLPEVEAMVADMRARRAVDRPLDFALSAFVIARPTRAEALAELALFERLREAEGPGPAAAGADPLTEMLRVERAAKPIGTNGGTAAGLVGSYAEVAERILAFAEAGIGLFMFQFQPLAAELRRFATEVLPLIRAARPDPEIVRSR